MEVIIRQETESDYGEIYKLNVTAFGQENEANLVESLRDSEAFIPSLSLVATINNQIVGHILISKIKILDGFKVHHSLSLAPMAVNPSVQKKGIGGLLIKRGLQIATELEYTSVIVLGHERYYSRFGFVPTKKWGISAPFEVPVEVYMGIELVKDGLKEVGGTVQYPKEFAHVE
jgi:predicted N-acetyltransferase YhbS